MSSYSHPLLPTLWFLCCVSVATGQPAGGDLPRCATEFHGPVAGPLPPDVGGRHITSSGVLRVLVVFASFHDDETPHPYWPPHQPPVAMSEFIDPDTTTRSTSPFNLTRYFREMSLGEFHVVGEAIWVESLQSVDTYVNSGSYGLANWNVIHDRVDPAVDFSLYDNWTNTGDQQNIHAPDSVVDMVIMVWKTTVFQMIGEASLGYKPGFLVDGKWLEMGFPERFDAPRGSGVTCEYMYNDHPERAMRAMAHELGHWLLGGPHPYNGTALGGKRQFWGILCAGERFSSCANAYERERLGWITVPELQSDSTTILSDFLTTGSARKIHPSGPGTDEVFYLENHQLLSPFDDVTRNPSDRGIWILHQESQYGELDNLRILPSDGGWFWDGEESTTACFAQGLPLFQKREPYVPFGLTHRDQIPTTTSGVNWIYALRDGDTPRCGTFAAGEGLSGAFTVDTSPVFSPYSNPPSHSWYGSPSGVALEVLSDSGGIVRLRRYGDPLAGSPARRHLGIDPTAASIPSGTLPLAWGAEWPEGQPLEADVSTSELQRRVGEGGEWTTVYQGAATEWIESSLSISSSGTTPVEYRARVLDAGGKSSAWSPLFRTSAILTDVAADPPPGPGGFVLEQNFPNPFNAETLIHFTIPGARPVTLRVYDMLGREVATLVDGILPAGSHAVRFDGSGLSTGSYLYRLTSADGVRTRTLLLLR